MSCVTLETPSTESGSKEFIAVGTTINRGEDLAAKGSVRSMIFWSSCVNISSVGQTYVFEIVEVVPDPALAPKRWYKLRLRFRDDAKGPVTAVCGFNGYLVSSMGQKVYTTPLQAESTNTSTRYSFGRSTTTDLSALLS
jgi:cleavage and polyadenylation specificity factor subunit 1